MNYQADIDKLKITVQQATEFHRAWDEFFDLTLKPYFITKSRKVYVEKLNLVLGEVCKLGGDDWKVGLDELVTLQYADSTLYHGILTSSGRIGNFMYFKDVDSGMVALSTGSNGQPLFVRFSLTPIDSSYSYLAPQPSHLEQPTLH